MIATNAFRRVLIIQSEGNLVDAVFHPIERALTDGVRVLELTLVLGEAAVDVEDIATIITKSHKDAPSRSALVGLLGATVSVGPDAR